VSIVDGKRYEPLREAAVLEALLQELEKELARLEAALGFQDSSLPADEPSTRFVLRVRLGSLADDLPRNLAPNLIGPSCGEVPPAAAGLLNRSWPELERLVREAARLLGSEGR
jgi:hypothetical protein